MSFSDNALFQRMGETAREECVNVGIIKQDQYELTKSDMKKIIEHFHGELVERNQPSIETENGEPVETIAHQSHIGKTSLRKMPEDGPIKFIIEYTNFVVLDLLHELGHVFLELDKMMPGDVRSCDDVNGGINELNASKFARAFAMPRALFEKAVLEHSKVGICNIQQVADTFGIDYWQVVSQGRQLQLW